MVSPADVQNLRYDTSDSRQPRSVNLYFDHYRGEPIYRTVVYLANSGCEWSRKTGGCTMCGTKNSALRRPISDADFMAQLEIVRRDLTRFNASLPSPVQTLHVYNDGFFFNDGELSEGVREAVYALARSFGMRKLVIETNGLDIVRDDKTHNYLGKGVAALGECEFEITLGLESANPLVRQLYGKPDSIDEVRSALDIIRRKGAIAKGYVLVKGPLLTEAEAYEDCVNTIKTLQQWSNGKRFRVEFQPTCMLPNTLHEQLALLPRTDPYFWEPPLLSTLFRILANFPTLGEDLYSALFARIDADSPWDFWLTRPHDDPASTYKLYLQLVEHYLHRRFSTIEGALKMANDRLWQERRQVAAPHPLDLRVSMVKRLQALAKKSEVHLSEYVKKHIAGPGSFVDNALRHLESLPA